MAKNNDIKKLSQTQGKLIKGAEEKKTGLPKIEHPVFCFKHIDKRLHPANLSSEQHRSLLEKFCELSQLTWNQIDSSGRKGAGTETIYQSQLSFTLPAHVTKDITIKAFKYCGQLSMVGYRNEQVFHILGIDIDFDKKDSCYSH